MRGDGPFLFAQVKNGQGVSEIADHILRAWKGAVPKLDHKEAHS